MTSNRNANGRVRVGMRRHSRRVIVSLDGGLGNQMFQYAFALALESRGKDVALDIGNYAHNRSRRSFELERAFAIELPVCSKRESHRYRNTESELIFWLQEKLSFMHKKTQVIEQKGRKPEEYLDSGAARFYKGFWQNPLYFKGIEEKIKKAFAFKSALDEKSTQALTRTDGNALIGLHVRRTDYQNIRTLSGVANAAYYTRAIQEISKKYPKSKYLVFSDDIDWCKANLSHLNAAIFVDWNKAEHACRDMQMMAECDALIIGNSTFAWWAAWLGKKGRTIIAPDQWSLEWPRIKSDLILPEWTSLSIKNLESPACPPIVFIIFNRVDVTRATFEAIRKAQPARLYVVADGPRNDAERERCEAVRQIIKEVDWDCEVKTQFSDTNMGCRLRVSSGITWAFEDVDQAIILEDDCLPAASFFTYCAELLERYKADQRVMMISGAHHSFNSSQLTDDYYFSRYAHIWGWATWKRAWLHYDLEMRHWPEIKKCGYFNQFFKDRSECYYWESIFQAVYEGKIDTWDYQWVYSMWKNNGLSIAPRVNLVKNCGFGTDATHTRKATIYANLETQDLVFPLVHPEYLIAHSDLDLQEMKIRKKNATTLPHPLNKYASILKKKVYRILNKS